MESTSVQDTDEVFVKAEPPEDVSAQDEPSCDVFIKTEPSCVKDEPLYKVVSFEMELKEVCVKPEPSKTDDGEAAGLYAGHLENNELVLEPVRGPEPAVKRPVATQGQSPKKKPGGTSKKFKCADCEYETVNLVSLVSHTKKHGDKKSGHKSTFGVGKRHSTVEAIRCGRIYAKSNLPHDVKLHKCNQCSFACTRQDDLLKHKILHTVNSRKNVKVLENERKYVKDRVYKCSYCSDAFVEEVSWQRHERKHTGEKPFKCDQCDYAGSQLNYLLRHKDSHINLKLYECNQCQFACAKIDDLLNHKVTHNDQPLKCGECSYVTNSNKSLQLHQATHTGEEIYKCSMCNYTALKKKNLAQHEARHAAKRFQCEKCSFSCLRQFELINHERMCILAGEKLSKCIQDTHA